MTTTTSAEQPHEAGVLADLDAKVPTSFYWYLALLACVGGFLFGYDTSNIGSALPFIPYHLSSFATGYLVAGASIGAAVGAIVAGPLTDRFGRKAIGFIAKFLPETKGLALEDVIGVFERQAGGRKAPV